MSFLQDVSSAVSSALSDLTAQAKGDPVLFLSQHFKRTASKLDGIKRRLSHTDSGRIPKHHATHSDQSLVTVLAELALELKQKTWIDHNFWEVFCNYVKRVGAVQSVCIFNIGEQISPSYEHGSSSRADHVETIKAFIESGRPFEYTRVNTKGCKSVLRLLVSGIVYGSESYKLLQSELKDISESYTSQVRSYKERKATLSDPGKDLSVSDAGPAADAVVDILVDPVLKRVAFPEAVEMKEVVQVSFAEDVVTADLLEELMVLVKLLIEIRRKVSLMALKTQTEGRVHGLALNKLICSVQEVLKPEDRIKALKEILVSQKIALINIVKSTTFIAPSDCQIVVVFLRYFKFVEASSSWLGLREAILEFIPNFSDESDYLKDVDELRKLQKLMPNIVEDPLSSTLKIFVDSAFAMLPLETSE
jgi:hypothetical protein